MSTAGRRSSFGLGPAIAYSLIVAYGTLYPFSGWDLPTGSNPTQLLPTWPAHVSRPDFLTNSVVYMPLGALLVWGLGRRFSAVTGVAIATLTGTTLSFALEVLQGLLPARDGSLLDLLLNGWGAAVGAFAARAFAASKSLRRTLQQWRRQWIRIGVEANLGLTVLGVWMLSQLSPLVPSADIGTLKAGLLPAWQTLSDLSRFNGQHALAYVGAVMGLGLLTVLLCRRRSQGIVAFSLLVSTVLLLKIPVETRQLSLEAFVGSAAGLGLLWLLGLRSEPPSSLAAGAAILGFYLLDGLRPALDAENHQSSGAFSWIPFAAYRLNLFDLADIVGAAWAPLAMAYSVRRSSRRGRSVGTGVLGAALILAIAFSVEATQRSIPGRTADITDCLIAVAGWSAPWLAARRGRGSQGG